MNARSVRIRSLLALAGSAALVVGSAAFAQNAAPAKPSAPPPSTTPPAPAPAPAPAPTPPAATTKPSVARADLPAAKDIVNQAIEAMGGEKAFDAIKSSMIKATMSTPMGELKLDMDWMKPNMVYIKQAMTGMDSTMGSDGSVSWVKTAAGYQILDAEQAKQMQEQSNMFRIVMRMRDESKDLKTVDQLKLGESDCYKVSSTDKEGTEQFAYFDVKDHLIRGIESTQDTQMGQVTSTIKFGEWKEAEGLKYFTKIDVEQMGMTMTLTFDEVTFNKLEADVFKVPDEVNAMLKAKEAGGAPGTPPATTPPAAPKPPATTKPGN